MKDKNIQRALLLGILAFCFMPSRAEAQPHALSASDPAGTVGTYKSREAVRVDLGNGKYAITTRNEGAAGETGCGDMYTFDEAVEKFSAGKTDYDATGVWRLPTMAELNALAGLPAKWTTEDGVNGKSFTVADGRTIFLPAAGDAIDGTRFGQGEEGTYRSSTPRDPTFARSLAFDSERCSELYHNRNFGCSVRLVCALPPEQEKQETADTEQDIP